MSSKTTSISKGTVVRTAAACLVVLNLILKALGVSPVDIEEGTILAFLEALIEVGVIGVGVWFNNSFSEKAKKAQAYLEQLRASSTK